METSQKSRLGTVYKDLVRTRSSWLSYDTMDLWTEDSNCLQPTLTSAPSHWRCQGRRAQPSAPRGGAPRWPRPARTRGGGPTAGPPLGQSLSHVQLFVTPWTVARQAPLSVGILQARVLEWVAMPSSRGSSQRRDPTWVSCTADVFFTVWATREAHPPGICLQAFLPSILSTYTHTHTHTHTHTYTSTHPQTHKLLQYF